MTRKRPKVLRIIARLNVGGPAIHTILLTQALNNDRFESILATGRVGAGEKEMDYLARAKGVAPLIIPELERSINPVKDLLALLKICSIIRREKPDIVHTHTAKAGALGRAAAIMAGVPVRIHTFHGNIFEGYFNGFSAWAFLSIERFLAFFSRYIVVVSETQKEEIVKKYKIAGPEKVKVVPLGLELGVFSSVGQRKGKLRAELGVGSDCVLIGIIGRLVPVKNHRMFLDACKKLFDMAPGRDIKCVVIGDGEEKGRIREYAEGSGIGDRIAFIGWKEDMADVYADLDIVALTSLNEGTPVALIEALASGKPVVSTDVGGVRDVVEDGINGRLAASGDVQGFARHLFELAQDPAKRDEFGKNGRRKVLQKYSKERLVKDIEALYEEALRGPD
ncbi:MAG: glycosyltransferase family 4 protein [Candidatus Omnitrophica bacterium]|nr:glycosyltransferase family 4 protein [Candidatus Omnitrophota bacterium]